MAHAALTSWRRRRERTATRFGACSFRCIAKAAAGMIRQSSRCRSPLGLSELSRADLALWHDSADQLVCEYFPCRRATGVLRRTGSSRFAPEAAISGADEKREPSHRLLLDLSPAAAIRIRIIAHS